MGESEMSHYPFRGACFMWRASFSGVEGCVAKMTRRKNNF